MIFLSHTHADKPIVDNIAQRLKVVFGQNKIFYDNWSIQPGDSIIEEINHGLENCEYFFFFVSKKSVQSNMVKIEWQNALYKSTKEKIKIIPVRMDDCLMPQVLLQTMYIDISSHGLETAVKQIIDVVNNQNIYTPSHTFQNIRAYVNQEPSKVIIEFRAEVYTEPHSKYIIFTKNLKEELSYEAIGETMFENNFHENVELDNGELVNAIFLGRQSATSPGFPFVVEISTKNNSTIKLLGISRFVSRDRCEPIPVI